MNDAQMKQLLERFDRLETDYQDTRGRLDFVDACLRELLRRLPGEGYWRPGAPQQAALPLTEEPPLPVNLAPATVVYPTDTATPRPSVSGPDTNLEWAKANPEAAREFALNVTRAMVGSKPED